MPQSHFISAEQKQQLFLGDTFPSSQWVGDLFAIPDQGEVIPFRYFSCRYLLFFLNPLTFTGDRETLESWAPGQLDGFIPHQEARILKFFRAEADEDEFKEKHWSLPHGTDIYPFCRMLTGLVSFHSEVSPKLEQYFYLAASPRLERLYKRVFRELKRAHACTLAEFEAILCKTGEYDGYQREVAQPESFRHKTSRYAA
jgi:hypothetical protein